MKFIYKYFLLIIWVTILCSLFVYQPIAASNNSELTVMFSAGGSGDALGDSAKKFGEKTGTKVNVLLYAHGDLHQKQVLALNQKNPIPDIIAIADITISLYDDLVPDLDVNPNILNALVPSMRDVFERPPQGSKKYFALPVRTGGNCIIYRDDIFKENNIDSRDILTWEDYLEVVKKLTQPEKRQYGYVCAFEPTYITTEWVNYVHSYNAEVLTADGKKAAFNTENGIKATKMFVDMFEFAPLGALNYGYGEQVEALQTGLAVTGMILNSRVVEVDSPQSPFKGNFKVLPHFPYGANTGLEKGRPMLTAWGVGLNPYSQNKEVAIQFLEFIASEEEQLRLAIEKSSGPSVQAVHSNPEFIKAVPAAEDILKALENGKARPRIDGWLKVESIIAIQLQRALTGEIDVTEALATAEKNVNDFLGEG